MFFAPRSSAAVPAALAVATKVVQSTWLQSNSNPDGRGNATFPACPRFSTCSENGDMERNFAKQPVPDWAKEMERRNLESVCNEFGEVNLRCSRKDQTAEECLRHIMHSLGVAVSRRSSQDKISDGVTFMMVQPRGSDSLTHDRVTPFDARGKDRIRSVQQVVDGLNQRSSWCRPPNDILGDVTLNIFDYPATMIEQTKVQTAQCSRPGSRGAVLVDDEGNLVARSIVLVPRDWPLRLLVRDKDTWKTGVYKVHDDLSAEMPRRDVIRTTAVSSQRVLAALAMSRDPCMRSVTFFVVTRGMKKKFAYRSISWKLDRLYMDSYKVTGDDVDEKSEIKTECFSGPGISWGKLPRCVDVRLWSDKELAMVRDKFSSSNGNNRFVLKDDLEISYEYNDSDGEKRQQTVRAQKGMHLVDASGLRGWGSSVVPVPIGDDAHEKYPTAVVLRFGLSEAWRHGGYAIPEIENAIKVLRNHELTPDFPGALWIFKGHAPLPTENIFHCTELRSAIVWGDLRDKYHSEDSAQHDAAAVFGYAREQGSNVLLKTGVMLRRNISELNIDEIDENAEYGMFNRTGTASAMYLAKTLKGSDTVVIKIASGGDRRVSFLYDGEKVELKDQGAIDILIREVLGGGTENVMEPDVDLRVKSKRQTFRKSHT